MPFKLVIGNKAYSSWSLRPWLLMRVFEIPFDEIVIPLYGEGASAEIKRYNPAAKVPTLVDGPITVWDSMAIIDYVAEARPDLPIWPADKAARALARSLAAEMHSGFSPLRRALPMNMRRAPKSRDLDAETAEAVAHGVERIEDAWADARARFGQGNDKKGGAFLFGAFCAADAMFAPIVNRFHAYAIAVGPTTRAYMDAISALPAWRDWQAAADAEGWTIDKFETL